MRLESWAGSDVGLVRPKNEDSVGCFPDLGLFVVCDGLGGHAGGELASRLAVDAIHDFVRARPKSPSASGLVSRARRLLPAPRMSSGEDLLREAVETAHRHIVASSGEAAVDDERGMATTVVVLKVDPEERRLAWAHVGDSRLYLVRDGALSLLTADHTIAGSRHLGGSEIPPDLPHSNRLLQALGSSIMPDVATRSAEAMTRDVLLLCSDGLSSLVSWESIRAVLSEPGDLGDAGGRLIQLALDEGGKDNTSAVLVRLSGE